MDGSDDALILVGTADREHFGEAGADQLGFLAEAAGDDHPAVLGDRLADRGEALLLGRIEEAAGVDQHDVGVGVIRAKVVAVRPELGEDALAVDQRLRAAERHHADLGRGGERNGHGSGGHSVSGLFFLGPPSRRRPRRS
jgi:hypothetical protein